MGKSKEILGPMLVDLVPIFTRVIEGDPLAPESKAALLRLLESVEIARKDLDNFDKKVAMLITAIKEGSLS